MLSITLSGCRREVIEGPAKSEVITQSSNLDARFAGYKASLTIEKEDFADDDPIVLKLQIAAPSESNQQAGWRLFTPELLRVQDDRGNDLDLMAFPVSEPDGNIRSKVIYGLSSKEIDLTSFVEPRFGAEHVYRFAPGKYTATFYFSCPYPHVTNSFNNYDMTYPKVWGGQTSNTVAFSVHSSTRRVDIPKVRREAEAAVAQDKANEAIANLKQIVRGVVDQGQIQTAIEEIMLIRGCRAWDDHSGQTHSGGSLKAAMAVVRRSDSKGAFRLSLLHLPEQERKSWLQRYVRSRYPQPDSRYDNAEEEATEGEIFANADLGDLFQFPQYRSLLLHEVKDPQHCGKPYAEIFLSLPLGKDPQTMTVFLQRFPYLVLEYYASHEAPKEMVPQIVKYFDDNTTTWGNGDLHGLVMDSAFLAFARATGMQVEHETDADRIKHREKTKDTLLIYWNEHKKDFEATVQH